MRKRRALGCIWLVLAPLLVFAIYASWVMVWTAQALADRPSAAATDCIVARDVPKVLAGDRRAIDSLLWHMAVNRGGRWGSGNASWHLQGASITWLGFVPISHEVRRAHVMRLPPCDGAAALQG